MQGSDRGFGKVKSPWKALSVTVELMGCCWVQTVVSCHPPTVPGSLWVFYHRYQRWHSLSHSVLTLACIAAPLCPYTHPPTYWLWFKSEQSTFWTPLVTSFQALYLYHALFLKLKTACFLSFGPCLVFSSWLLTQVNTGGCLSLGAGCQAIKCLGRRHCWPWVKVVLLSLTCLIDSLVFTSMCKVKSSIPSISRGCRAAAMVWLISLFLHLSLTCALFLISNPFYAQKQHSMNTIDSSQYLTIPKPKIETCKVVSNNMNCSRSCCVSRIMLSNIWPQMMTYVYEGDKGVYFGFMGTFWAIQMLTEWSWARH